MIQNKSLNTFIKTWLFSTICSILLCSIILLLCKNASVIQLIVMISCSILLPQSLFLFLMSRKTDLWIANKEDTVIEPIEKQELIEEISSPLSETLTSIKEKLKVASDIPKPFEDTAMRANLFQSVFFELCDSISKNLSATTEPLSFELLNIRKTMTDFLGEVKQYEDEVKNHVMLDRVANESEKLRNDMMLLSKTIKESFTAINNQFSDLKTVSSRIAEVATNITEVSEKIRILSFNASIEAARAGKVGSGFRVIASEIKNLSANTESHLARIWEILKETQVIFSDVSFSLDSNTEKIEDVLSTRQNSLDSFVGNLNVYFDRFDQLYINVNEVIGTLSASMDTISPVVQLHEITGQEIGNLSNIAIDFSKQINSDYLKCVSIDEVKEEFSESNPDYKEKAEQLVGEVRRRLTTERELQALERGITNNIKNIHLDLGMDTQDIEIF